MSRICSHVSWVLCGKLLLIMPGALFAAIPSALINCQGVLRGAADEPLTATTTWFSDSSTGRPLETRSCWVANSISDDVTKVRASDGSNLGTFPTGNYTIGVAFDGSSIRVTNGNSGTVSKL